MDMLQVDTLAYNTPSRYAGTRVSRKGIVSQREANICLRCPLPDCKPFSTECPVRPIVATGGNPEKGHGRETPRRRRAAVKKYGLKVHAHLLQHGPSSCPEIAAAIGCEERPIYTTMASLILEHGVPIKTCGMRHQAALYRIIPGAEGRPLKLGDST